MVKGVEELSPELKGRLPINRKKFIERHVRDDEARASEGIVSNISKEARSRLYK